MDIRDQKRILRRTTLAKCAALSPTTRAEAGRALSLLVMALPEIDTANEVMIFASFGTEIPTDDLLQALLTSEKRVLMPYVDGRVMRAAVVERAEDLAPGYRGIREPAVPATAEPGPDAVLLVPGVAFDLHGGRLGYGGGFYDTFLAGRQGHRIGLCFDCQLVDGRVPLEPHDLPVEAIVTESRVIRPA